jgi:hypothetical protein
MYCQRLGIMETVHLEAYQSGENSDQGILAGACYRCNVQDQAFVRFSQGLLPMSHGWTIACYPGSGLAVEDLGLLPP